MSKYVQKFQPGDAVRTKGSAFKHIYRRETSVVEEVQFRKEAGYICRLKNGLSLNQDWLEFDELVLFKKENQELIDSGILSPLQSLESTGYISIRDKVKKITDHERRNKLIDAIYGCESRAVWLIYDPKKNYVSAILDNDEVIDANLLELAY